MLRNLNLALAAVALALAGCSKTSSTDIKTSGMYLDFTATADGAGSTDVSASVRVGGMSLTFVELEGGDTLTATSGADTKTLSKVSLFNVVSYNGTFTGDQEDKDFTVALSRPSDTPALNSSVTLPAPLTITGPAAGTSYSRANGVITVTWGNSGKSEPLSVSLDGNCIDPVSRTPTGDPGTVTFNAGEVKGKKDHETETCDVTVNVRRTRAGTVDPAFGKGGSVKGVQSRRLSIKSTP